MLLKHPKVSFISHSLQCSGCITSNKRVECVSAQVRAQMNPLAEFQTSMSLTWHIEPLEGRAYSCGQPLLISIQVRLCSEGRKKKNLNAQSVPEERDEIYCFVLTMFKSSNWSGGKSILPLFVLFVDVLHEDFVFQSSRRTVKPDGCWCGMGWLFCFRLQSQCSVVALLLL